ncbi:MAG: MBL fold metallo-hydrolase [Chitinophagaceae bacterium]
MTRLVFTTIMVLIVFPSFGQININEDSIDLKIPYIKVTLLGTGTPPPLMERFGPSILVEAGSETLLFDAGRGCLQRLRQINRTYEKISALFLTHLHSDHIVGLPDLWLTGWLISERRKPLNVFGPAGTNDMLMHLQKAFAFDIKLRIENDKQVKEGSKLLGKEIQQGTIYQKGGVKVTAFNVDHYDNIPAFGYRIDYNGHSVVLSGDTRYSENLIKFAKGTDVLVHEVVVAPDTMSKSNPRYNIFMQHTTPEQVAKVFNEVKPKLGVYSHISKLYGQVEEDIMRRTKATYLGPLIMGEDLMSILISNTVSTNKWQNK